MIYLIVSFVIALIFGYALANIINFFLAFAIAFWIALSLLSFVDTIVHGKNPVFFAGINVFACLAPFWWLWLLYGFPLTAALAVSIGGGVLMAPFWYVVSVFDKP